MGSKEETAEVVGRCSPPVLELVEALRQLVRDAAPDGVELGYRGWGIIGYSLNGMFCYIGPQSNGAYLAFHRGTELPDPHGLLQGKARWARRVKFTDPREIKAHALKALVWEAYKLNVVKGGGHGATRR